MKAEIRNAILLFVCCAFLLNCGRNSDKKVEFDKSAVAHEEKIITPSEEDWIVLFDGSDFNAWRGYNSSEVSDSWEIREEAMVFLPGKEGSHNIITKGKYENFILSLEWKVAKGANSGIFWGVHEAEEYSQPYLTGPEIQILDNENNPEGLAANGTHAAGSLFDMLACDPELVKPFGSWNRCVIEINHQSNKARVDMNGSEAMTFPLSGQEWEDMVAKSKFKDWKGFGKYKVGHIGLQDHGDEVWFRNIKIREIK